MFGEIKEDNAVTAVAASPMVMSDDQGLRTLICYGTEKGDVHVRAVKECHVVP